MAAWWWWCLWAAQAADMEAVGILKAASAESDCRAAWLMSTVAQHPAPLCLQVSGLAAAQRATLEGFLDEEVRLEGSVAEGTVRPTQLFSALGEAGGRSLDYHVTALPGGTPRSFDVGRRLRENPVPRLRLQTPQKEPVSIELIFQGIRTPERLEETLSRLQFLVGAPLTPLPQRSGATLVLLFPPVAPHQLFVLQSTTEQPLAEVLVEGLYGGDRERLSMTLLLSPLASE